MGDHEDDGILEAWGIAHRMTLYVLDALPDEALADKTGAKGRSVGEMFAHIHNNRRAWLEVSASDLLSSVVKLDKEQAADKTLLRASLDASGAAMSEMFSRAAAAGKVKGFKRSVASFLGYAIAHEGYHLGEIGIALGASGHRLPQEIAYGMWEWGKL
jgi:uncharacterized damage-inducible protein DinB